MLYRLPQQSLVHLIGPNTASASSIEPTFSPFIFTTSNICHRLLLLPATFPALNLLRRKARSARTGGAGAYLRLPPAFFEAFNGSTVPDPAKPRRSRGGVLAFEIST